MMSGFLRLCISWSNMEHPKMYLQIGATCVYHILHADNIDGPSKHQHGFPQTVQEFWAIFRASACLMYMVCNNIASACAQHARGTRRALLQWAFSHICSATETRNLAHLEISDPFPYTFIEQGDFVAAFACRMHMGWSAEIKNTASSRLGACRAPLTCAVIWIMDAIWTKYFGSLVAYLAPRIIELESPEGSRSTASNPRNNLASNISSPAELRSLHATYLETHLQFSRWAAISHRNRRRLWVSGGDGPKARRNLSVWRHPSLWSTTSNQCRIPNKESVKKDSKKNTA